MFGQPARNCRIRSESFSTAHSDRRRPQVALERRLHLEDPCAARGNCEGTVSRAPTSAASPSSAASWPNCTHHRTVQKLNSGQFPSPAMSGGHKFPLGSRIASRLGAFRVDTPYGSGQPPATSPRTAHARPCGRGPTHLLAVTPSELACSSLRLAA